MLCLEKAKHKFFVSFMIEILPDETCHIQDKRSGFVLILNRIVFGTSLLKIFLQPIMSLLLRIKDGLVKSQHHPSTGSG